MDVQRAIFPAVVGLRSAEKFGGKRRDATAARTSRTGGSRGSAEEMQTTDRQTADARTPGGVLCWLDVVRSRCVRTGVCSFGSEARPLPKVKRRRSDQDKGPAGQPRCRALVAGGSRGQRVFHAQQRQRRWPVAQREGGEGKEGGRAPQGRGSGRMRPRGKERDGGPEVLDAVGRGAIGPGISNGGSARGCVFAGEGAKAPRWARAGPNGQSWRVPLPLSGAGRARQASL
ncbi:hypothetical protein BDY21DRAFT_365094 [Lineolata rhizophorae]|uniref:Uncharacterized protein n=1 Tax=Lineolata rhizophorae TaxID=578093 RepID=A0A6A6NVW8_9PEZI|nr:hypothetical protein BDY21DRAFT_365094 [Lineolata rhizophorae]